jgi:anti-anti-sigma factor
MADGGSGMLTVTVEQKARGTYVIYPAGSLNASTDTVLEEKIDALIKKTPGLLVLDLAKLEYISSAGIRVLVKTRRALQKIGAKFMLMNPQPQIQKVFDIVKALPSEQIFASLAEFDAYLEAMQKAVKSDSTP